MSGTLDCVDGPLLIRIRILLVTDEHKQAMQAINRGSAKRFASERE